MMNFTWNPMSAEQERMWYMNKIRPKVTYNGQFCIALKGIVNVEIIYKTIGAIIQRHDTLKMKLHFKDGISGCAVYKNIEPNIKLITLSGNDSEKELKGMSIAKDELKTQFNLEDEFPLRINILKYDENNYKIIFTTHHIYFDAWSVGLLIGEFKKYYLKFECNQNVEIESLDCQFSDFVVYQKEKDFSNDRLFWENRLKNSKRVLNLPYSYFTKANDSFDGNSLSISCDEKLKVLGLCKKNEITSLSFFLSIYFITLMIFCKQNDITIGIPYLNRNSMKFQKVIGYFANTIAIQETLDSDLTFIDLSKKICKDTMDGIIHGEIPFNQVVDLFRDAHITNKNPIYQTMFSMRNDILTSSSNTEFSPLGENLEICTSIINESENVEFDLMCTVNERLDDYRVTFDYNSSLFSADRIMKLTDIYKNLLHLFLNNSNENISNVSKQYEVEFQEEYLYEAASLQNKLKEQEINILDVNIKLVKGCAVVFYVSEHDLKDKIISLLSNQISDIIIPIHLYKIPANEILYNMAEDIVIRSIDMKMTLSSEVNIRNIKYSASYTQTSNNGYNPIELVSPILKTIESHEEVQESKHKELSLLDGGDLQNTKYKILSDILYSLSEEEKQRNIVTIEFGDIRKNFTYGELLECAEVVAGNLQAQGINAGDVVIIQINNLEHCMKVFWGAIFIGAIVSIVAVPQEQDYNGNTTASVKVKNILGITEHTYVIAEDDAAEALTMSGVHEKPDRIIRATSLFKYEGNAFKKPQLTENDITIMLFTSGSTGLPKGVTLSHRNIILRTAGIVQRLGLNESDISLNWMPFEHVGGIVMFHITDMFLRNKPIYVQTKDILRDPARWVYLMSEYKVTLTWAPNFAYSLLMKHKHEIQNSNIDLSNMKYIINAGEPINFELCNKWLNFMASKGLQYNSMIPVWGMTETTSGVLVSEKFGEILYKNTIGTGSPNAGVKVRIVSSDLKILPQGKEGLLQISGETINQGYYHNATENKRAFTKDNWFDTGDLGIIMHGEVIITGRAKEILIINGVNISCQEIEKKLEEIDELSSGSVACTGIRTENSDTDEFAVFYGEADHSLRAEVKNKICDCLIRSFGFNCQYLIPVEEDKIARSAIGKIEKKSLIKQFLNGELKSIIERNQIPNWFYKEEMIESQLGYKSKATANQIVISLLDNKVYEDDIVNASSMCSKIIEVLETKLDSEKENSIIILHEKCSIGVSSLLEGFLTSIPYEYSHLKIRLIEVEGNNYPSDELLQAEFASIEIAVEKFSIVSYEKAYTNRKQLAIVLQDMREVPMIKKPFTYGGKYILFGGLGGIGTVLTKYLLKQYNCNIIAIGKTDVDKSHERKLQVQQLEHLGNFSYKQVNLENPSLVQEILKECGEDIDGIFFMIGEASATSRRKNPIDFQIKNYSKELLQKSFSFRCRIIDEICKFASNKEKLEVIAFSSLTSFFGGSLYSIYSATSRYLYEIGKIYSNVSYHAVAWSKWKDVGMSSGESTNELFATENAGYRIIEESTGIISMEAVLSRDYNQVLIGINSDKNLIHNHAYFKEGSSLMLYGQVTETDSKKLDKCNQLLEKLQPVKVDTYNTNTCAFKYSENSEEIQSKVLSVLSKILDTVDLSINDNFFDIGGNSLNSIRASEELSKACECEFSVVDIYGTSTISEIISSIQSKCDISNPYYGINIEKKLIDLISQILDITSLSGNDNFFDVGGNSLNSIRFSEEISEEFKVDISVVDIYGCSTIHELALHIMQKFKTNMYESNFSSDSNESMIICI